MFYNQKTLGLLISCFMIPSAVLADEYIQGSVLKTSKPIMEVQEKIETGILGMEVQDHSNRVRTIFRGSDASDKGVQVGDAIIAADGHREVWPKLQKYTTGKAGTLCNLLMRSPNGSEYTVQIERRPYKTFMKDRTFQAFLNSIGK